MKFVTLLIAALVLITAFMLYKSSQQHHHHKRHTLKGAIGPAPHSVEGMHMSPTMHGMHAGHRGMAGVPGAIEHELFAGCISECQIYQGRDQEDCIDDCQAMAGNGPSTGTPW